MIGLVLALLLGVVGLVISIVARSESKRSGFTNTPAVIGIVIGAVSTGLMLIAALAGVLGGFVYASF